jgi:ketosteroid isomerase-like protein
MKKTILVLMTTLFFVITGCNNEGKKDEVKSEAAVPSADSKEERNKKVVMSSLESFIKGDIDGIFKDVAVGFVDYTDGTMPPITSIDTLKSFIKMMKTSIEGYKGENLEYYADGDYVIVHGDWGGVFKNDMGGIKATGKPVKYKDVDIFKLNDEGKIVEHHSVQNMTAALMTAK